jgi:hypothetical protein
MIDSKPNPVFIRYAKAHIAVCINIVEARTPVLGICGFMLTARYLAFTVCSEVKVDSSKALWDFDAWCIHTCLYG